MKVKITYKAGGRVGPDDWDFYTKVVDLDESMTLKEAYEKLNGSDLPFEWHVELHFDLTDEEKREKEEREKIDFPPF